MRAGPVEVYRNLHIRDRVAYSIRSVRTKKVMDRKSVVTLSDVSFRVSQAGRARVIAERRKNVHAVIRGVEVDLNGIDLSRYVKTKARYNPYLYQTFVDADGNALLSAAFVTIDGNEIFAYLDPICYHGMEGLKK